VTVKDTKTTELNPAEFDHFGQEFAKDPDGFWRALRDIPGLARSEKYGGFRMVARYADICAAARNPGVFCSGEGIAIPRHDLPNLIPGEVDPPLHHQYRKILNVSMSPQSVKLREAEIGELADELLAPIADAAGAEVEFCGAFAIPFPQHVALRIIGFPDTDRPTLGPWMHALTHLRGIDNEAVAQAGMRVVGRIVEHVNQRRTEPRRDDLLSLLLDAQIDGRPITDEEILFYVLLLLFGGLDTTSSAIAGSIHYLAQHPEVCPSLLDDEEAMDRATDELIRWTSPIQGLGRTVTQDTELAGCRLRAGEKVLLMWGSGNRDESVFHDAESIVIDRFPNNHLSFGMGPHRCIGSHLAKAILKVAIERCIHVLGDFSVADPAGVRWVMGEARGIGELPLRIGVTASKPQS
jgi:cytochrome P450